jgi:SAM-dependent methyltransferase
MTRILRPDETLHGYDQWAGSYDGAANPLVAASSRVLDLEPLGAHGLDVVELGCGTGRNLPRVLGEGARSYTGVDGSPGMLARARAIAEPRARWLAADLHAAWPTTDRFDLAFLVLVLEHLRDLSPLVHMLSSIVRPDGRVRIVDIHPGLVSNGTVAHFQDGATEVRFTSTAHDEAALRTAFRGWDLDVRTWIADDAMIAAVPKLAKHRGRPVLVDVRGAFCRSR